MPDYSDYNARKNGKYADIWTKTGKCVFCDLKDKYIIAKNASAVLTVNIFPYIDGHLLVIPIRHVEDFLEVTPDEWSHMRDMAELGTKLLRCELGIEELWLLFRAPGGFRAQKTVPHCHMLVLPYKKEIVNWNYQEITIPPIELAERLRNAKISDK